VDKAGAVVKTAVKPGTRVRVYYANTGNQRMIDHVVVLD
jgi:tRNA splicing endonuclease